MSDALLTVDQVAEQVGLSRDAVYRAIHDGQLAASKLRGRLRIHPTAVTTWIDAATVIPTADVVRIDRIPQRRRRSLDLAEYRLTS